MSANCQNLVDAYVRWLKATITVEEVDGACQITTPFLDRHNDRLQILVERKDGTLLLTDDGYILSDLEMSGCNLDTPHRRQLLDVVLSGFGVRLQGGELTVEATEDSFPQKKHALIQAMMTVNDTFMTASPRVISLFLEDVTRFLEESRVRYAQSVEFTGRSGFVHKFDFLIPRSPSKPERLLRAINQPTRDNITSLIFARSDTRDVRRADSLVYAVLNDTDKPMSSDILTALVQYEITPLRWTERAQYVSELAA